MSKSDHGAVAQNAFKYAEPTIERNCSTIAAARYGFPTKQLFRRELEGIQPNLALYKEDFYGWPAVAHRMRQFQPVRAY
jgi:hypothetical protein